MEEADATLAAALATRSPASPLADRLALVPAMVAAVDAVAAAHARGIVHGALTPACVAVGGAGDAAVTGWPEPRTQHDARPLADEVATVEGGGPLRDVAPASSHALRPPVATAYLAAERLEGDAPTARGDVHALGAILYHVLAGARPYAGVAPDQLALAVLRGPPRALAEVAADAPAGLVAIATAAMARDADARPGDAGALARALADYHAGLLAGAPAVSRWVTARRWLRRRRVAVAAVAVVAIAATAAGALAIAGVVDARADDAAAARRADHAAAAALDELGRVELLNGRPDRAAALLAAAYAGDPEPASPARRFLLRSARLALDDIEQVLPPGAPVRAIAFDRFDGTLLVARDVGVEQWTVAGTRLATLRDGDAALTTAHYTDDGAVVIAAEADVVRVWDAHTGDLLDRLTVPDLRVAIPSTNGHRLLAIDGAGVATIHDTITGTTTATEHLTGTVAREDATAVGSRLLAMSASGPIAIWNWMVDPVPTVGEPTWRRLGAASFDAHDRLAIGCGEHDMLITDDAGHTEYAGTFPASIASCTLDYDGQLAVVADRGGVVASWRLADNALLPPVRVPAGSRVEVVAPGVLAATAPYSDQVSLYASDTGALLARYTSPHAGHAAIGRNGRIALPRDDGSIDVVHVGLGRQRLHVARSDGIDRVYDLRGGALLTAQHGAVTLWDVAASRGRATLVAPARLDAAGGHAVGLRDGAVVVLAASTGGELGRVVVPGAGAVRDVDVDLAGRRVAVARADGVTVWDVATRTRVAALPALADGGAIRLAGDGRRIATIAPDGRIAVSSLGGPDEPVVVDLGAAPSAVATSRDGTRLAVSAGPRTVVIDLATGARVLDTLGAARSLAFDRSGDVLAGYDLAVIRVWRLSTRASLAQIATGRDPAAVAVAISADGALVATAAGVWSVADGRQLAQWLVPGASTLEPPAATFVDLPVPVVGAAAITDDDTLVIAAPVYGITTFDVTGETAPADVVLPAVDAAARWRVERGRLVPR